MTNEVVASALVDVCKNRVPSLPREDLLEDRFVEAVHLHRIAPLAHVLLREDRPEIAERLRTARDFAMAIHLRSMVVLAELGNAVGDIPWAAFKGPVLSEFFHPVSGLRSYGDVDVLVAPGNLREVAALVEAAGWSAGDHLGHQLNPDTPGEMHWRTPSGLLVDMHWSMINMAAVRRRHNVPTCELLDRRCQVRVGLSTMPILNPIDGFVHLCMHAALTGAHKMLWLLDVEQMARQITEWEPVFERARQWQVHASVALVLRRASHVLGLPIPVDSCERLGVSPLSRDIMDFTDRWSSVPSLHREESLAKAVSRGIQSEGLDTLRVMGQKTVKGAWHRRPGHVSTPVTDDWVVADHGARDVYLAAVEAEAAGLGSPS